MMSQSFDPLAFHTDPNAEWARKDLELKAQSDLHYEVPLYRYGNDILKGYFDTRARLSVAAQYALRDGYSLLPEDDPLGLSRSVSFPGRMEAENEDEGQAEADTSIVSRDTQGAELAYSRADGREPNILQPDFILSKRMGGSAIPLHKIFGIVEFKRNNLLLNDRIAKSNDYPGASQAESCSALVSGLLGQWINNLRLQH
ncbi:hypothetical protein CALCODRAFT_20528 [Calocera cornea HHB12733]|uniref:Uncharacterized protein n=1 Tax=Calocera cornea HHB12733 TaxID=1353952 RepID=A0A165E5V1_9BASI|nr:hypothetical protein CALCODRAFT_20528 [Calocera cornea HHB12733]